MLINKETNILRKCALYTIIYGNGLLYMIFYGNDLLSINNFVPFFFNILRFKAILW